jgi:hypothetical protein
MPIQGLQIALTTSPTAIAQSTSAGAPEGTLQINLYNRGAAPVYLGGPTVTTSGYALTTDAAPLWLYLQPWDALYGTSTGSITIHVIRMGETT